MKKMITYYPLIFLITCNVFANQQMNEQQEQFLAHMVDHIHRGCPTNSTCSEKMGIKRKEFIELLKEKNQQSLQKFIKTNGLLYNAWSEHNTKSKLNSQMILWDSPCFKHRQRTPPIEKTHLFVKNLQQKTLNHLTQEHGAQLFFDRGLLLDAQNKVSSFYLPTGEYPISVIKNKLYFTREIEGIFYGLTLKPNGSISLQETITPKRIPYRTKCPPQLVEKFNTYTHSTDYQGHGCLKLWNQKQESNILLFPVSCY